MLLNIMIQVAKEINHGYCGYSAVTDWGHTHVLVSPIPWDVLRGLSSDPSTVSNLSDTIRGVILEMASDGLK